MNSALFRAPANYPYLQRIMAIIKHYVDSKTFGKAAVFTGPGAFGLAAGVLGCCGAFLEDHAFASEQVRRPVVGYHTTGRLKLSITRGRNMPSGAEGPSPNHGPKIYENNARGFSFSRDEGWLPFAIHKYSDVLPKSTPEFQIYRDQGYERAWEEKTGYRTQEEVDRRAAMLDSWEEGG